MNEQKILIMGAEGTLGRALQRTIGASRHTPIASSEVDICDAEEVMELVASARPHLLVNCAAFTRVDECVTRYELAHRVNGIGPMILANACLAAGIPMVHLSTNEVFEGTLVDGYEEWMPLNPVNPYGMSKAAGEFNVRATLARHYIIRTAWLYGAGGSNFVHAILKRAGTGQPLRVVTDEIGNPTYVEDLAQAILNLIETGQFGTYHLVNGGACSRWEFANGILKAAGLEEVENQPITRKDFVRDSTPPEHGVLKNLNGAALGIRLRPWEEALREFVAAAGMTTS